MGFNNGGSVGSGGRAALIRGVAIALVPVIIALAVVTLRLPALAAPAPVQPGPVQTNPTCPDGNANDNAKSNANGNANKSCWDGASGYTISKPRYNLEPVNPRIITSLVFTVSGKARPTTAQVQLSTTSRPCVVAGQNSPWTVTCVFPQNAESVRAAIMFAVILSNQ